MPDFNMDYAHKKESKLYSVSEMKMLQDVTASVEYKYGYDPEMEIDYVYKAGVFSDSEITAKSPDMKKVLQNYSPAEVVSFFEKIIQLRETQIWKMNKYKGLKKWADATYIQKYPLPETDLFMGILEKNVIQIDAAYAGKIEKRKEEIRTEVSARLQKQLEDEEKKHGQTENP